MLSSKKMTCKGTLRQGLICLRPRTPYHPLDVSVLQLPVLPLNVSPLHHSVLCAVCLHVGCLSTIKSLWRSYSCLSTRAFVLHLDVSVFKSLCSTCAFCLRELFAAPGRVCLQEPLLPLYVSFYMSFCSEPGVHVGCLSFRACAALVSFCLHELFAAPGRVCLQEPLLPLYVSFYMSCCSESGAHVGCLSFRVWGLRIYTWRLRNYKKHAYMV